MKHKTSILICVLDDGIANLYVNGSHVLNNTNLVVSPEKLADKVSYREVRLQLNKAAGTLYQHETQTPQRP